MHTNLLDARASLEADGVFKVDAVPQDIASSWNRCLGHGLDPCGSPIDAAVSHRELYEAKQRHETLMAVVRPELELLSNQISGSNHLIAFADNNCVVLDAIMDHEFQESDCSQSIRNGTIWSEDLRGTNGLGLAHHTGNASIVTGGQHFLADHAGVSCVATPIFDSQGNIAGLLDASSELTSRQNHTLALVSLAATNIENRLFINEHRADTIIQFHPREEYLTTQSVGMVSVDKDGCITGANRYASKLFNGLYMSKLKVFSDLFQGGFGTAVSQMRTGNIVRLVDWLNAGYFARMRISHPSIRHKAVALSTSPLFTIPRKAEQYVFNDERTRNGLRLALRSAKAGLPICVSGPPGSGRTSFARAIHQQLIPDSPMIEIDCDLASEADQVGRSAKLVTEFDHQHDILAQDAGVLVIENLAALRGEAVERVRRFVNRLQSQKPNWYIFSTEISGSGAVRNLQNESPIGLERLTWMKVHLPALDDRADFASVATHILATISAEHRLSSSSLSMLKKFDRPNNLSDLADQLRFLVVHCAAGIIREEHIERILGLPAQIGYVCSRCEGNPVREAKCREINRMYERCNSNVALTARTLSVSRNTVYAHIPK
ncbi:MAG: GAF domain-containing protein [Pseudoruegeria sp.]